MLREKKNQKFSGKNNRFAIQTELSTSNNTNNFPEGCSSEEFPDMLEGIEEKQNFLNITTPRSFIVNGNFDNSRIGKANTSFGIFSIHLIKF